MKRIAHIILFLATTLTCVAQLVRTSPEDQGIPSASVEAFFDSITSQPLVEVHSAIVMRHGKVVGEIYPKPFGKGYRHNLYSASKPFVSAAVGIAIRDGALSIDDPIVKFFGDELPASPHPRLHKITVRHLLTMTSGITPDWEMRSLRSDWIRTFLAKSVDAEPGTLSQYDSMTTYMLSAVVQRATGTTVFELLQSNLFEPMGITDAAWELSPEGISTGGWGLQLQPESMAKFGQLLLNGGEWNGKQLLPRQWVKEMLKIQVIRSGEGYGFNMRECNHPGTMRADGAYGQYIVVDSISDMVVVMTQCSLMNAPRERALIWNTLCRNLSPTPLPESADFQRLCVKQRRYSLPTPSGMSSSTAMLALDGNRMTLGKNPMGWKWLEITTADEGLHLTFGDSLGKQHTITAAFNRWSTTPCTAFPPYNITASNRFDGLPLDFPIAASYAWTRANRLVVALHYVNWISSVRLSFTVADDNVDVEVKAMCEK